MIRFGVIGTNWITDRFLKAAQEAEDFTLAAVYSRTQEKAEAFAAKHGAEYTYTSLQEIAESREIDAVYIASPNGLHAEQAILFMNNGKHVLCEKPIASNTAEVRQMIEAAKANGTALMEAMKSTLMPNFDSMKSHLSELGTIRTYFSNYSQYSSRYDAYREGTVLNAFKPELSNGALMDLGVYTIYPLIALFGKPDRIKASGHLLETGADGQGSILLSYPGMEAAVLYSKITSSSLPSEIHGEDGTMVIHHISSPEKVEIQNRDGSVTDVSAVQDKDPMYYELAEFIHLIKTGKQQSERNSWEISLAVMEVMDEARRQIGIVYPADKVK